MPQNKEKKFNLRAKLNKILIRYYIWWAVILVLILFSLSWLLLLGPQYDLIQRSGILQLISLQEQLSEREAYLADLKIMKLEYNELDWREVRNLDLIIPKEDELTALFWQIEELANNNGVELVGLNLNIEKDSEVQQQISGVTEEPEDQTPAQIKKLGMTATFNSGSQYQDLKKLLIALENNLQILNIKSLTYVKGGESYALSMETYYLAAE